MQRLLFLFLPLFSLAKTYTVTSVAQANSTAAVAGDTILITGTSYGTLQVKNGVHYVGQGAVITGMVDLSGWTLVKPNIWEAAGSSNVLTVNGVYYPYGRTGWKTYSSATATTLSDGSLTGSWVGGQLVLRKQVWIVDRGTITAQSTGKLTWTSLTALPDAAVGNSHYFIQNTVDCLTSPGDWCSGAKIDLFWPSQPTGVQIATLQTLVEGTAKTGATFEGISFVGCTGNMVNVPNSSGLTFTNCSFTDVGENTFYISTSSNLTVQNCAFEQTANDGILGNGSNCKILNNSFHNTGMYEGMQTMRGNTSSSATAIKIIGDGNTISGNLIVKTGYNGIDFKGSNVNIAENRIDSFCCTKADGGAIYSWNGETTPGKTYNLRFITGNIITNGTTPSDLSVKLTNGVYLDDNSNNVTVRNNFVQNVTFKGIYLHNAHEITVTGNISIGAGFSAFAISHGSGKDGIKNITLRKNVFIQTKVTDGNVFSFETNADSVKFFGSSDSNIISCIGKETAVCYTAIGTTYTHYSLASWFTKYGFEKNSTGSGITDLTKLVVSISSTRPFTAALGQIVQPPVDTTKPIDTTKPPPVFKNVAQSKTFTRNNCGSSTGTSVVYTVPAGKYQGTTQADADSKATQDINTNGQSYANINGTCTKCSWWNKLWGKCK